MRTLLSWPMNSGNAASRSWRLRGVFAGQHGVAAAMGRGPGVSHRFSRGRRLDSAVWAGDTREVKMATK